MSLRTVQTISQMPTLSQRQAEWQKRWEKGGLHAAGPKEFIKLRNREIGWKYETKFLKQVRQFIFEDLFLTEKAFQQKIIKDSCPKIFADLPIGSGNVTLLGGKASIASWLLKNQWQLYGADFCSKPLQIAQKTSENLYPKLPTIMEEATIAEVTEKIISGCDDEVPDHIVSSRYLIHEDPHEVKKILAQWSNLFRKKYWMKIILILPLANDNGKKRKNLFTYYPDRDELLYELMPLKPNREEKISYYGGSEIYRLFSFGAEFFWEKSLIKKLGGS